MLDLRREFPILEREFSGYPLAYLDSAATTQKPVAVLEAMNRFYRNHYANVHRASYPLSAEASEAYEGSRHKVARFVGADPKEIVFVRSATEAINLVAQSWGRENIRAGDTIVLSEMEHHANIVPWQILAKERGARIVWISTANGILDPDSLQEALRERPALLALTHVSNVLGTISPVAEIIEEAHAVGAHVLIDGSQAASRIQLQLEELRSDFYVFGGHKLYGPTGIGVLHAQGDLLREMPAWQGGGGMIQSVTKQGTTFREAPARFEAGTPPIAEAVGLAAALDWIDDIGLQNLWEHESALTEQLLASLAEADDIWVPGPRHRTGVVSFEMRGVHSHDVAEVLARYGLALRAGHHCAQVLMQSLGVPALARASFAAYNSSEEIERLLVGLEEVRQIFK